jgi:hypothetical protein
MGSCELFARGGLEPPSFLISASQGGRITGMSYHTQLHFCNRSTWVLRKPTILDLCSCSFSQYMHWPPQVPTTFLEAMETMMRIQFPIPASEHSQLGKGIGKQSHNTEVARNHVLLEQHIFLLLQWHSLYKKIHHQSCNSKQKMGRKLEHGDNVTEGQGAAEAEGFTCWCIWLSVINLCLSMPLSPPMAQLHIQQFLEVWSNNIVT